MSLKSKLGSVTINTYRGIFRLRLPRNIAGGSQVYLYSGLSPTSQNTRKLQIIAFQIESDIESQCFDTTLETYKQAITAIKGTQQVEIAPKKLNLSQLWCKYCDFKESQVASTTFKKDFLNRYQNIILGLPTQKLTDAIPIRDYLIDHHSPGTAKRLLMQINACCKWAKRSGFIAENPFIDLTADIRVKRWDVTKIDPFTSTERDSIIFAFESDILYQTYSNFVRFLFMTGCRPGEAFALKWCHVKRNCSEIYFCENYAHLYGTSSTKDGKNRKFPCNETLKNLLLEIKPKQYNPKCLVFPSPINSAEIKTNTFDRIWKSIVNPLIDSGVVSRYRRAYNTRHTFISGCLAAGIPVQQVAAWVGNSPEIIFKHYAKTTSVLQVPEF